MPREISRMRKLTNLPIKAALPGEKGVSTRPIDVHRVLLENAPKGKPGPKPKNGKELAASAPPIFPRGKSRSKSAMVLKARLAQEKPRYYDALMSGVYASTTAAATAVGLPKDDANLRLAKSAIRKMTAPELNKLLEWMKSEVERRIPGSTLMTDEASVGREGSPSTLFELQSIDDCEIAIRLAERSDEAPRGYSRRFTAYALGMKASVV